MYHNASSTGAVAPSPDSTTPAPGTSGLIITAGVASPPGSEDNDVLIATDPPPAVYTAALSPLNDSNVTGNATLVLSGDHLTVTINAQGLEPDQSHIQHIHGRFNAEGEPADSVIPGPEADADGDGSIEIAEGSSTFGPVIMSLGTQSQGGTVTFPTAPDGTVTFQQTFDLNDPNSFEEGFSGGDLTPLDLRTLMIHGMSVDGSTGAGTPGEIDGTAGYKAGLPVAAGEIELVSGGDIVTELQGDGGNDTLVGTTGTDNLFGDAGTDTLFGKAGEDSLDGGEDADTLTGGGGADVFIISSGADTVTDFDASTGDRILLDDASGEPGAATATADGALVQLGQERSVLLIGVDASTVSADFFISA